MKSQNSVSNQVYYRKLRNNEENEEDGLRVMTSIHFVAHVIVRLLHE